MGVINIINLVDKTKIIFTHVQKITVVSHQGTSRIVDDNHFLYSCDPDVWLRSEEKLDAVHSKRLKKVKG